MLLDDLRDYLLALGLDDGGAWPISEAHLADDSDQAICVYETGGYPPTEINRETENVTFQLRVRGQKLDYAVIRAKWKACFDALQDSQSSIGSPMTLPGVIFIQALHYGPVSITDDKGRPNLTSNFRVKRTYA